MSNGASDDTIAAYAAQLLDLESDIETLQGDKKDVYANARETYGKRFADSLKLAIKRHRMDADKRDAADEIDAEAERMLAIISRPSAPRATRAREIIEEFDPETGEIKPLGNGASGAEEETQVANSRASSSANNTAETPNIVQSERDTASSDDLRREETASDEQRPTDGEVIADRSTRSAHSKPAEGNTPTSAGHGDRGAVVPSVAPVVADEIARVDADAGVDRSGPGAPSLNKSAPVANDYTKPNPWCLDQEECGLSSWDHFCLRCQRVKAERDAIQAVQ